MNPFCCSSTLERGLHIFSSNELTSIRNRRRHSPLPRVTRYCYTAGNRRWNKFNKIKLNYVKNPKQNADMEDYSVSPGRVLRKRRYSVLRFVLRTQLLKSYTGVVVDVKILLYYPMSTSYCVPECQQKGGKSSAGEKVWFFEFPLRT